MLELLFLLLPVAASYGWYMGRRSMQQNNQKDKRVDLFLDMLKEDNSTIEAHFTLGNLFRSCGEISRAIRIHQALMESTSLTFKQRLLAIQQLGNDYMAAGFYDRAEDMLQQLVHEEDFQITSLNQLLQIYQATSEWLKAIYTAEQLVKLGKEQRRVDIAHFYCELALQAIGSNDLDRAIYLLKKGALADKNSVRISIMRAHIRMTEKDYAGATGDLTRVLEQDREMVSETLPMLQECYQRLGQHTAWEKFLKRCVEDNTGSAAELLLTDIIEHDDGVEVAKVYTNQQLLQHPTLHMFYRLMNFHLSETKDGREKESLKILRDMVGEKIRTQPRYRCQKCGFTSYTLYWHCPSCKSWASVKPIRGLDGQ